MFTVGICIKTCLFSYNVVPNKIGTVSTFHIICLLRMLALNTNKLLGNEIYLPQIIFFYLIRSWLDKRNHNKWTLNVKWTLMQRTIVFSGNRSPCVRVNPKKYCHLTYFCSIQISKWVESAIRSFKRQKQYIDDEVQK